MRWKNYALKEQRFGKLLFAEPTYANGFSWGYLARAALLS